MLLILLLAGVPVANDAPISEDKGGIEWIKFDLPKDTIRNFVGHLDESISLEERPLIAHSRIGIHDSAGTLFDREIPAELLVSRPDLSLVLVSSDFRISDVRNHLQDIQGLEVREFIAPSGLLVQGTQNALNTIKTVDGVSATQPVPLAMLVDFAILSDDNPIPVRIESWRSDILLPGVDIVDDFGMRLFQNLDFVAKNFLTESYLAETGRYDGYTARTVAEIASEPSVAWVGNQPILTNWNDQSRNHMNINAMKSYYTTDLDGSGQIVAVADSGLDHDHGDFGNRIIGNVDVIGDGSTADAHSGHGTHVACTVLGDGSRGNYQGVAPEAELYFQAMENDNNGNFQWASINNMLNTAYSNGARIHSNSWGSTSSDWGEYTSSSEDVDDRTRYYDQYYSGREGLVVLFAAGNDGPNSDTIGSPGTAKNTITVGNSQNRYSGAPNSIMDGSSRGPVDDGRIKPDILAPGGYVRSCKAQEATDTGGATWSSNWYLEYTGTSMATPNAAGTAALIREYITEVAQRPEPQGALVKALMILGARDVGARDIPNMDEGWGRIDLKSTLAPNNGRGIWVDDRSVLSSSGNSKSYSFNITTPNQPFKAVVAWSDERGSRFSNTQLVNNLNLLVTTPSGIEYKGNQFSQGRSIQGGSFDSLNNVEVVLIDSAETGLWTVKVTDSVHSGSRAQPFAIAVSGVGVNDLRPDPSPIQSSLKTDISIPQVGDEVLVEMKISNLGNVKADDVEVIFQEEGLFIESQSFDLGPGGSKVLFWDWQPQTAGGRTLTFLVDSNDIIDEINEANNRMDVIVNVTTPGVRIESAGSVLVLDDIQSTTSYWQIVLTNTALLSTNASISAIGVENSAGESQSWYVGLDETDFNLQGQEGALINVTLVHPAGPNPGFYSINLLGYDEDNSVSSPYTLTLDVPVLSETRLELDYTSIPVDPSSETSVDIRLFNLGNTDIGYDVFLDSPPGWHAGFDDLSSQGGAVSASTGLMLKDGQMEIGITFTPPQVMTLSGTELTIILKVFSQTEEYRMMEYYLPLTVTEVANLSVDLESSFTNVNPGSTISLQYTIENLGNIDLSLEPELQLPIGWSRNTDLNQFDLAWTESKNLLISVTAGSDARSGEISLVISDSSDSWSYSKQVNVTQIAMPVMTFAQMEIGVDSWADVNGPGTHPAGVPINYTWLVENQADTIWTPSVSLKADPSLLGDCSDPGTVSLGDIKVVECTIIISSMLDPGSEPQFKVELYDSLVSVNQTVSMVVAVSKELRWEIDRGSSSLTTGEESTMYLEITNTGNSFISGMLTVDFEEGLSVEIEGPKTIDLVAGQSVEVVLKITSLKSGQSGLEISLSGDSEISSQNFDIQLTSDGDPVSDESSSSAISVLLVIGVILVIGVSLIMVIRLLKNRGKNGGSFFDSDFA